MIIIKKIKHISSIPRKCAYFKGPILRGKDIKRNGYQFADLWLITTHNGYTNSDGETITRVKIEDYPTIKKYLDTYNTKVTNRSDQGDTPYNLRSCAYMDDFSKQKIVWNRIASEKVFGLVEGGIFISDSMHFIVGNHLEYICAILNGKLFQWLLGVIIGEAAGGNAGNAENVTNLTLPIPLDIAEKKVQLLLQKSEYHEIDKFVYEIYGLTDDEINFISSSVKSI